MARVTGKTSKVEIRLKMLLIYKNIAAQKTKNFKFVYIF